MMSVLSSDFYQRDTTRVAQDLLGKRLVRRTREGTTAGRIVEVEAYLPDNDPACHAARGHKRTNAAMFGPAGRAYVYPIHSRYCFNTVTQPRGRACAVLIRAVEPIEGIALMQQRRGCTALVDLARGPARLCQALAIDRRLDHWDLTRGHRLWIDDDYAPTPWNVGISVRIGVTSGQQMPLRYYFIDCQFVSGPRGLNRPRGNGQPPNKRDR
jgi:DNA-3-methyladenine glycosylase